MQFTTWSKNRDERKVVKNTPVGNASVWAAVWVWASSWYSITLDASFPHLLLWMSLFGFAVFCNTLPSLWYHSKKSWAMSPCFFVHLWAFLGPILYNCDVLIYKFAQQFWNCEMLSFWPRSLLTMHEWPNTLIFNVLICTHSHFWTLHTTIL